ncbi:MAG: glycosyltransferase family 4 protein [Bacteroidota bacterium]
MNVLHINQSYEIKGGAEVYVHQLQELLPKYGVSSFFVAVSDSITKKLFDVNGKNVSLIKKSKYEVEEFLSSYIEDNKIDLIHIHSISNIDLVKFCLHKKPVIRSMHEPRMFCPGRQKFFLKSETICNIPFGLHCCMHAYTQKCQDSRIPSEVIASYENVSFEINYAAKKYKCILAMSDYIKKEALLAGIPGQNIIVIPFFTPIMGGPNEELYQKKTEKHIVFVGRLHASKGVHTLIKSLSDILKKEKGVFLDIIGDGLFKKELLKIISSQNIPSEKVIFHGWLKHNDTIRKIKDSYLVVFPSIYPEAFGLVGIEAMMHSKPVVAFDAGGVSSWLKDQVTGFLVDIKDEIKFAEKVSSLLNNEELYMTLSLNARKLALENFVPKFHLETLVKLYKGELPN